MLTTLKEKQRHGGYLTNSINLSLATKIQTLQISDNEEKIKMLTTWQATFFCNTANHKTASS